MSAGQTTDGREYVGAVCTLDGREAAIIGRQLQFGVVITVPAGPRVEFAWPTIARIMQRDAAFKS